MPLHHAAANGHAPVVAVLLEHGADVNAKDAVRASALHTRVRAKRLTDQRRLLSLRSQDGNTPLQHAAVNGNEPVVALLLERGADADAINAVRAARNVAGKAAASHSGSAHCWCAVPLTAGAHAPALGPRGAQRLCTSRQAMATSLW